MGLALWPGLGFSSPCGGLLAVYTLPLWGESRGRWHSAPTRVYRQQLRQLGNRRLGWDHGFRAGTRGLELQDALTKPLQGGDPGLDTGDDLRQCFFQECANRFAGTLKRAHDECLDLFQGESQGAQTLDHLHTPHRFFSKQAVVALAAAPGGEKPEVLVVAQDFDRYVRAPGKLPDGHRIRP